MKDPKRKKVKRSFLEEEEDHSNHSNLQSIPEDEILKEDSFDIIPPELHLEETPILNEKPIVKRGRKRGKTIDLGEIAYEDQKLYGKKIRDKSKNDEYFRNLSLKEQIDLVKSEDLILSSSIQETPLRYRIIQSLFLNNRTKNTLLHKMFEIYLSNLLRQVLSKCQYYTRNFSFIFY